MTRQPLDVGKLHVTPAHSCFILLNRMMVVQGFESCSEGSRALKAKTFNADIKNLLHLFKLIS